MIDTPLALAGRDCWRDRRQGKSHRDPSTPDRRRADDFHRPFCRGPRSATPTNFSPFALCRTCIRFRRFSFFHMRVNSTRRARISLWAPPFSLCGEFFLPSFFSSHVLPIIFTAWPCHVFRFSTFLTLRMTGALFLMMKESPSALLSPPHIPSCFLSSCGFFAHRSEAIMNPSAKRRPRHGGFPWRVRCFETSHERRMTTPRWAPSDPPPLHLRSGPGGPRRPLALTVPKFNV